MADEARPTPEELIEQIRALGIDQFLLSTVSMLTSLAFAKIAAGELEQARVGIDALRALQPVLKGQIEDAAARELEAALANLQLA